MTIFGWDMSHYDAPTVGSALSEGIEFITHKAGGDALDAELGIWWSGIKAKRGQVLLGAYWVLYPGSPSARADAFLARLDSQCPGWRDGPFILQVDCERWNGDPGTVPSVGEINSFCDRLVGKTKLRPVVYAPDWVYGDLSDLRYPLWSSKYVAAAPAGFKAMYPGDMSSKWAAYGGKTPTILQYTSKATIGGQTLSDANAYRGTLAELTALVAPETEHIVAAMDLTDAAVSKIWNQDGIITNPADRQAPGGEDPGNEFVRAAFALGDVWEDTRAIRAAQKAQGDALMAAIKALASKDMVDEVALGNALAAGVAAAVVAKLPAGTQIDQDMLNEAVLQAFHDGFSQ